MFECFASLSPALRLALILAAIVTMMRLKVPYGLVFLSGAGLTGALFAMGLRAFAGAMWQGVCSEETVFLIIMVSSILILSMILNQTGQTDRIIESFRAIVGPSRWTLVMFPALIGMLPMPGGAIFSAPMVESAVKDTGISPARAAIANYWFRHIWEFWLPLYPGVILCLTLTQAPIGWFILLALPMTFWALACGYWIILRGVRMGDPFDAATQLGPVANQ
ncbi:MAG: DUF401 family protein, partial [Candidatus Sumerlaeota bacterium]|nr:DUF401 family protein [Candidatus Sumerlaeota bacterium]